MYVLDNTVRDPHVCLQPPYRERPTRIRVHIQEERDQRLALQRGEHDCRGRAQEGLVLLIQEGLDCERVLDREERKLGSELRARRPEVSESFQNLHTA